MRGRVTRERGSLGEHPSSVRARPRQGERAEMQETLITAERISWGNVSVAEGKGDKNRSCTAASENPGMDHAESETEVRVLMKTERGERP